MLEDGRILTRLLVPHLGRRHGGNASLATGESCVSERRSIISPQSNEPLTSRPDDHGMTPLVPPFIQHVIQQQAGPLAYIPTVPRSAGATRRSPGTRRRSA